jgi:pimeloyl-ACP methyl ester carboxylesterase
MATARINDIDIYYEEHGDPSAAPLLLIMGFMMNAAAWAPQTPAFAERYRVIAFDNRGAGRTSQPEAAYTIPQMAADAAGLVDHLGIASANIIGVSMGGMIAQEFAIRYPARVRRLVLACTTPGGPHSAGYSEMKAGAARANEVEDVASAMTPELVREFLGQLFTPEFLASPGPGFGQMVASFVQYPQTPAGLKGQAAAIAAHNTHDRLDAIAAPTLVIAGDADPMIDPANARILAERIPGAELRLMPGLRHGFMAEKPDESNEIVLEFLGRQLAAAG